MGSRKIEGKQLLMRMVCAAVFVTIATASAQAAVPTYTGCYNASSGTVNKLALGFNPQKACANSDVLVSFAAGDITKISVTGGLTGGGDNGDITISLDPKYSLPQSCGTNQVAKWNGSAWLCANDEDTTYSNGTGLNLSGSSNSFSIASSYRLPQSCSDGSVPKLSGGNWVCASESAGPEIWMTQVAMSDGWSGNTGGTPKEVVKLTLPAGTYVVHATGVAIKEPDTGGIFLHCYLVQRGVANPIARSFVQNVESGDSATGSSTIAISTVVPLSAQADVALDCTSSVHHHMESVQLVAIKAGTVHVQ